MKNRAEHLEGVHETSRLTGFTDAIAGVALTVLILPLTAAANDDGSSLNENPFVYLWTHDRDAILNFIVNFYLIAWFWLAHNRVFGLISHADTRITQLAFFWIMGIIAVPFTGGVIGQVPTDETHFGIALAVLALGIYFAMVMWATEVHLRRNPGLRFEWVSAQHLDYVRALCQMLALFCILLLGVALLNPELALNLYLLLSALSPAAAWWVSRTRPSAHDDSFDVRPFDKPTVSKPFASIGQTYGDSGRAKNFSDGVVAVAVTLLILPLCGIQLPTAPDVPDRPFVYLWQTYPQEINSFLISFGLVAWFWLVHHRLLSMVRLVDGWLLILNCFWLFGIVSLPFFTEVIANSSLSDVHTGVVVFYLSLIAYLGIFIMLMGRHIRHSPDLWAKPPTKSFTQYTNLFAAVFAFYVVALLVLALVAPTATLFAGLTLFLIGPAAALILRLKKSTDDWDTSTAEVVATLQLAGCVYAEDEARILVSAATSSTDLDAKVARRVAGEPLEQVVGYAEFCGLKVRVEPGVFVPRRRTEFLVAEALTLARSNDVVVDLCCGSGGIGMVVGAKIPDAQVYAVDIDSAAVACARLNLEPGHVFEGDLYSALPERLKGMVNLLICNAPYVPTAEIALLPTEAREHESTVSLDGGVDGLEIQRRAAHGAAPWLAPGGHLLIETTEDAAVALAAEFAAAGLSVRIAHSDNYSAAVVIGRLT